MWLSTTKVQQYKGHFPLDRIFRAEPHFLLFKDQLAESGRQKTKENVAPRGKLHLVENGSFIFTGVVQCDSIYLLKFSRKQHRTHLAYLDPFEAVYMSRDRPGPGP